MRWKIEYRNNRYYAFVKGCIFWRPLPRFVHMYGEEYDCTTMRDALALIDAAKS